MKSYQDERANYRGQKCRSASIRCWISWSDGPRKIPQAPALISIGAEGELVTEQTVSALARSRGGWRVPF